VPVTGFASALLMIVKLLLTAVGDIQVQPT